jgi:hypothetical protein
VSPEPSLIFLLLENVQIEELLVNVEVLAQIPQV